MKKEKTAEIAALIRKWERVKSAHAMMATAVQTAAVLSRVNDVPTEVLDALDVIMSSSYEQHGISIYRIVQYLRGLQDLERLTS